METGLTARAFAAELLKIRKRWMPYVILIVLVLGVAVLIWLGGDATWIDERDEAQYEFGRVSLRTFALPWSLPTLLDSGQFYGAVLVAMLIASVIATEHNWGTVRQALIRGQTRSQYLAMKLIGLVAVSSALLLTALAVGMLFSLLATIAADLPVTFDVPGGPSLPEALLMVLRAGYAIIPYGCLAFMLAVIGRSTALSVVGTLLYMFMLEAILIGVLTQLGGPSDQVLAFFIGHNAHALIAANRIGFSEYGSVAPREMLASSELPDPWVAALVLAFYSAVFLAIAFYVFARRDLGTDEGGG